MKRAADADSLWLAWGLGLGELIALVLATVWLLFWPPVFWVYCPRLGFSPSSRDALFIANWIAGDAGTQVLNVGLAGGELSFAEIAHFEDVRRLVHRLPSVLAGWLLGGGLFALWTRPTWKTWHQAHKHALMTLGCLAAITVVYALLDWHAFFGLLHKLLFPTNSYIFPRHAYSLQLFPGAFWRAAGILCLAVPTAVLIALGAFPAVARMRTGGQNKRQDQ